MATINRTSTSFGHVDYNQVLNQLGNDLDRKPGETYQDHANRQTSDLQTSDQQLKKFEEALKNFGNNSKSNSAQARPMQANMAKGGRGKRTK